MGSTACRVREERMGGTIGGTSHLHFRSQVEVEMYEEGSICASSVDLLEVYQRTVLRFIKRGQCVHFNHDTR